MMLPSSTDEAVKPEMMALATPSSLDSATWHASVNDNNSKSNPGKVMTSQSQHTSTSNKNKSKDRGLARQRRNSWMRSSVVRRAATVVDEEVEALCEKSPFLSSAHNNGVAQNPNIALFHRREIELGRALGRGGFAEVYAVAGFELEEDYGSDDVDESEQDDKSLCCRRRHCQVNATTTSKGRPPYAIKFLKKKLLSNTREFQHAAIDLAVEAQYLAAMNHPNIIKIRALAMSGTAAFKTGKHDDYFIVMDNLQETLDQRIQRWQKRRTEPKEVDKPQSCYYCESLKYAHQIADALAYLHDKSIVYR
jgi:hypothetical protein